MPVYSKSSTFLVANAAPPARQIEAIRASMMARASASMDRPFPAARMRSTDRAHGVGPASVRLLPVNSYMRVTVKGQITIPKELRDALGIGAGTEVAFEMAGTPSSSGK
jgi:AbrB family looped-hinge helix DNA binding protein